MFAQVKDVKSVSSKRPLSIIAEQDGHVAELKTFNSCPTTIDGIISKDSGCQPIEVSHEYAEPLGLDSKRSPKMAKGKRRSTPKQPASPSKSHQSIQKPPVKAASSEKLRVNPAKHTAESKDEVLECSPRVSYNNNGAKSYKDADIPQLIIGAAPTNTCYCDNKHIPDHIREETDSAFTELISKENIVLPKNSQTVSPEEPGSGSQKNVEGVHKAPQLARLSILSSLDPHCVLSGPDGECGGWTQDADLENMHEMCHSTEQNIPQITITTVEGSLCATSRAFPPAPWSGDDSLCKFSSSFHQGSNSNSSSSNNLYGQASINRSANYDSGRRPKLVHLSKIINVESSDRSRSGSPNPEHSSPVYLSDFWRLKETTEKLHLSTRRPSTMLWRQQYLEGRGLPVEEFDRSHDNTDDNLTTDRKQKIDAALEWLRNELQEMRSQDQNLARQLLTIRQDIHQLKLQRSTEEHQELIEDFQSELDDLQEFSDVLDLPQPLYGNNPLKHVGVTRLNISARRFSAC